MKLKKNFHLTNFHLTNFGRTTALPTLTSLLEMMLPEKYAFQIFYYQTGSSVTNNLSKNLRTRYFLSILYLPAIGLRPLTFQAVFEAAAEVKKAESAPLVQPHHPSHLVTSYWCSHWLYPSPHSDTRKENSHGIHLLLPSEHCRQRSPLTAPTRKKCRNSGTASGLV